MGLGMSTTLRVMGLFVLATALPLPAVAQYAGASTGGLPARGYSYAESPGAALARNVRVLAESPRNFEALIGAGKAALATGDPEAAIGFYGRAEEVNPRSWTPKIGQGAALVQMMDAPAALAAFGQAQRLGASQLALALERGLAFDLSGDQARAQSDFRVALGGSDPSEARRRLALSLAISNKRAEALAILDPLLARRDPGALRARAFVLAMTGDPDGARSAVNAALPGLAGTMDPFLRRLASLRPSEKAAAVHFGVIPGSGAATSAYQVASNAPSGNRLGDIEQLLRTPPPSTAPVSAYSPPAYKPAQPVAVAVNLPTARPPAAAPMRADAPTRLWLQLASGSDAAALPGQFQRITARERELFKGINGYVAEDGQRVRLLIGPFKNEADAQIFADDLASVNIDAFSWTSKPGQQVRKISAQ